jgi:hypothetical protein
MEALFIPQNYFDDEDTPLSLYSFRRFDDGMLRSLGIGNCR